MRTWAGCAGRARSDRPDSTLTRATCSLLALPPSPRDYLIPLNETVVDQKIFFVVEPLSSWKAQLMSSMENSFKLQVGTGTEL